MERTRSGLEDIDQAGFAEMVRSLVRTDLNVFRESALVEPVIVKVGIVRPAAEDTGDDANAAAGSPALLPLIRQLGIQWSRSEHLLVRILAVMLDTDEASAAVVFSTLSSLPLRTDLVRRLMLVKVGDSRTQSALAKIIDDFDEAGRVRQNFMRDMFTASHDQASQQSGEADRRQVAALVGASNELVRIAGALEGMIPRLKWAMGSSGLQEAAD